MKLGYFLVLGVWGLSVWGQPGATSRRDMKVEPAARRVALVIGNAAYPKWPLKNSSNDAKSMASALRDLSFETTEVLDGTLRTIERSIDRFVAQIRPGDVALFYYAGHGVQLAGENYLIPVDFDAKDEADAKYAAYSISRVQDRMENAGARLSMLILDACRNNPFRTGRAAGGGLAVMNSGRGTLIAFATGPGKVADDNPRASNGLFTSHLISALREPGLTLDGIFNRVREEVYADSNGQQVPWTVSSVIGEFQLRSGSPAAQQVETSSAATPAPEPVPATRGTNPATDAPVPEPGPTLAARGMDAVNACRRGDYDYATRVAQEVLRADPRQKDALLALAASGYGTADFDLFERTAPAAVRNGAGLPFSLMHHHTLTGGHPAMLIIKAGAIAFDPMKAPDCNQRAFEEPLSNLVSASQTARASGEVFLTLKMRDPKGKVRTFDFADPGSTVDKSGSLPVLREPANAARRLQALANVIARASRPASPDEVKYQESLAVRAPAQSAPSAQRPAAYTPANGNPERAGAAAAPNTVTPGARSRVPDGESVLLCSDPVRLDGAMDFAKLGNAANALQALRNDAFFRVTGPTSLEVKDSDLNSRWPKVLVKVLDGYFAGRTGWALRSELKDLK